MYTAILVALLAIVAYLAFKLLIAYIQHLKAHQFFKQNAPNLPVLPPSSTFMGSASELSMNPKNWKLYSKYHEQFGPSFGFYVGVNPWIATKDLDLLKLIEVDDAHKHINRAKFLIPFYEFDHSIFQTDDDTWRRIRRIVSPALTNHKVRSPEISGDIQLIVDKFAAGLEAQMERRVGPKVKGLQREWIFGVEDAIQRYAMAIVFLITYKRDDVIDFHSDHDSWVEGIAKTERELVNPITLSSMVTPALRPFAAKLIKFTPVGRMHRRIMTHIEEAVKANKEARKQYKLAQEKLGNEHSDESFSLLASCGSFKRRLVDSLIDAVLEKKITYDHLKGTGLFLFLAGFETTSDTIVYFIWTLAHRPDIQERLCKALMEKGIDAEYMHWCIMETVRMHPAVPSGVGRILGEDVTVNGQFYPKGAFVLPSTYSIHLDPKIWPEPQVFKPERWQDTSKNHPAAFMGFGLGPRNCVGGKLAVQEIKLVMRMLLSKYRIEKCKETVDEYEFSSPGMLYATADSKIIVRLVEREEPLKIGASS